MVAGYLDFFKIFLFSVHGFVGAGHESGYLDFLEFFLFSVHGIVRAGHVKIIFSGRCITRPKNSIFSSQNLGRVRSPPLKICFYPPLQMVFVVVGIHRGGKSWRKPRAEFILTRSQRRDVLEWF